MCCRHLNPWYLIYFTHRLALTQTKHDGAMTWELFLVYWPLVRRVHRSPAESPHNRPIMRSTDIFFFKVWLSGWINSRVAGSWGSMTLMWRPGNGCAEYRKRVDKNDTKRITYFSRRKCYLLHSFIETSFRPLSKLISCVIISLYDNKQNLRKHILWFYMSCLW